MWLVGCAGSRGTSAAEGYHGPAEAPAGFLGDRVGHCPQVHLLLLLPPGSKTEGDTLHFNSPATLLPGMCSGKISRDPHSSSLRDHFFRFSFSPFHRVLVSMSTVVQGCPATSTPPVLSLGWGSPQIMLSTMSLS